MVFIDHKIFDSELSFCKSIAFKMGLRMSVIDFLIVNRHLLTRQELQERIFIEFMA